MAIVTIFGGTFGDDEGLAKSVAETLGYPYVSREILVEASQRCEVPEAKLSEIVEKEPHWWERWQEKPAALSDRPASGHGRGRAGW
jgi:Cytidylate kinase-like family